MAAKFRIAVGALARREMARAKAGILQKRPVADPGKLEEAAKKWRRQNDLKPGGLPGGSRRVV